MFIVRKRFIRLNNLATNLICQEKNFIGFNSMHFELKEGMLYPLWGQCTEKYDRFFRDLCLNNAGNSTTLRN